MTVSTMRSCITYVTKTKKKETLTHACTEKIVNFIVIHACCMFYRFSILCILSMVYGCGYSVCKDAASWSVIKNGRVTRPVLYKTLQQNLVSATKIDGEVKVISKRKCISYLVAILEACHTDYQDAMNLTTFARVLNNGTVHCAWCLIIVLEQYLYTIGLLFVLQTHVIGYQLFVTHR